MKKSGMASAELAGARRRRGARHGSEAARRSCPAPRELLDRLGIPFAPQTPEVFEGAT